MEELETINPFTLAPWEKRVQTVTNQATPSEVQAAVQVAVDCSAQNGIVGIGIAIQQATSKRRKPMRKTFTPRLDLDRNRIRTPENSRQWHKP